MEQEYDFEKLAQEIVLERLRDLPNPPAAAGEIALKIAVPAVTSTRLRQDPRLTVSATCRGVMRGMLLLEKDLGETAVSLLNQMAAISQEADLDPAECMTWAMEGMAPICRMADSHVQDAVSRAIEEHFMGAGEVFQQLIQSAPRD
ncbi:MAG: hypothetical protein HKL90_01495 [Elusimicrobia bacterium]|nr:hypothetical protein [Elusimicrobiota bacterium]